MSDPLIGSTIGGCEIQGVLGHGGMGIIYKARQVSLDRIVALKVLAPRFADDINFVARFQREARAIARVNHQNILAVYDVGSEDNTHYMIMELIAGESLAERQERMGGPLKLEEACAFIQQAAQGLEAAQAAGVTHRDIKPENLMVTKNGNVIKVSDFGLAKEADSGATSTDAVMGTPAFMSPEQCDGKKVDGRSDIYSLGATFYKLVTGRLPFEAETAMSMMYRHKHEALVPPKEIALHVPAPISELIVKMMAKKREARPQSMTEVLSMLAGSMRPVLAAGSGRASVNDLDIRLPKPTSMTGRVGAPPPTPGAGPVSSRRYAAPPPGVTGKLPRLPGRSPSERLAPPHLAGTPRVGSSARSADHLLKAGTPGGDGAALVARGDQLLAQGDRLAGLKCFREALKIGELEAFTRERVLRDISAEIQTRRQAGDSLLSRGLMVEASREFRLLLDLDPDDEEVRGRLKELERKLADRRTIVNDIRTAVASLQFEKALSLWDNSPPELRDEGLSNQIDHVRKVIAPSLKLCDKGDAYIDQGRLEEALATYHDALRIDEHCERARQGLRDSEIKINRINAMLREGYEYNLKQDYEKAIEMWMPIMKLRPGHPQATKSIVDTYVLMAQARRAQGDLNGALSAYLSANEVDPQNPSLRRQFEEMVELHDKEQALLDRARDAGSRRRRGEAIRYWQEILRINPSNKWAGPAVRELKRERFKALALRTFIACAMLAALASCYQFVFEWIVLKQIEDAIGQGAEQRAINVFKDTLWIIYKKDAKALERKAQVSSLIRGAAELLQNPELPDADMDEAVKKLEGAAEITDNAREKEDLILRCFKIRTDRIILAGKGALRELRWEDARRYFNEAKLISDNETVGGALSNLSSEAHQAILFIDEVVGGLDLFKQGRKEEALEHFKRAAQLRPDDEFVEKFLVQKLDYSPDRYQVSMTRALKAVAEPWREDAIQEAEGALAEATKADPGQAQLAVLKAYLADAKLCDQKGMALATYAQPQELSIWSSDMRRKAFCIDRYEYPNRKGEIPKSGVTWLEAKDLCERDGKRLCTEKEWRDGCKAKMFGGIWTFGSTMLAKACNWEGKDVAPSGSFTSCRNTIGAFDMSGNLAEWTNDGPQADQAFLYGGSFVSEAENTRCQDGLAVPKKEGGVHVGFRCCNSLGAP